MTKAGYVDQAFANYLRWYAEKRGWSLSDVAKKLERPGQQITVGYASHLLNGRRAVSKRLRDPIAKTFAWGTWRGARNPVFLLALIDPPTGTPALLRGKDRRLGYFTSVELAWQVGATMQTAGVGELTAIPTWPHMLGPEVFPKEPESQHLDATFASDDSDEAGYRIGRDILAFVYEALDLRDAALAIRSPREAAVA